MKPPVRKTEYERVPVYDEWITGTIDEVTYDLEHKRIWKGEEKVGPAIRFSISLEGCKFPKKTPWYSFNTSEKANLYKIFVKGLVEGAEPNIDFDFDALKGLDIKAMFTQNGEYDNLTMIRPLKTKIPKTAEAQESAIDEPLPF